MSNNHALGMLDLAPRAIVADDRDDGQVLAYHAFKFHAVQAECAIPIHNQDLLTGASQLRRHRETRACAKTTHRPGIEPVTRLIYVDDAPGVADDVAAIAHYRRILIDEVANFAAEAHRMNRNRIGIHGRLVALLRFLLLLAN